MNNLTLGSLFDGSGGFPLGGLISGITPVWASEIEPFPIRVTTKRLPFMKHYGDISQMDGGKIEPVDIITFGSPCTDMSVAGRRAGLEGQQSVLFYQAIRIIKEMRCATNGKYPRYIVWENVPGAFSSNGGEDFKAVLEAVIGVAEPNTQVPMPEKNRWPYADCYMGDGWSVAYRVLDAQFWGVPQRRKRIYLVADFAGGRAFDILFKSEGLSGYSAEGFRSWQRTAGSTADRTGTASLCLDNKNGPQGDGINEDVSFTLNTVDRHAVYAMTTGSFTQVAEDKAPTVLARDYKDPTAVCYGIGRDTFNQGKNAKFAPTFEEELQPTLVAKGPRAIQSGYTVRRLTPTECARLQGFPDWWCDDLGIAEPTMEDIRYWYDVFETHRNIVSSSTKPKSLKQIAKWLRDPHSDAAEYKMWGNGVALPCVVFVLSGIVYCTQSEG
ncbi:MAG: DNA cytosine methyltransferase [Cellvibrionales bacterium]|nr:DNA cytosine methyltransferase [Cellvibrionales bacterium]